MTIIKFIIYLLIISYVYSLPITSFNKNTIDIKINNNNIKKTFLNNIDSICIKDNNNNLIISFDKYAINKLSNNFITTDIISIILTIIFMYYLIYI